MEGEGGGRGWGGLGAPERARGYFSSRIEGQNLTSEPNEIPRMCFDLVLKLNVNPIKSMFMTNLLKAVEIGAFHGPKNRI